MTSVVRLVPVLIMTAVLGACASGQKFTTLQATFVPSKSEGGRIFFYRPSAFGAALRPVVLLNDERVGEAQSWGFFFIDRSPENYVVVTSTEVTRKVSFTLEAGQTRYIRFSTSFGFFVGHVYGELVDDDVGLREIKDCVYIGDKSLVPAH